LKEAGVTTKVRMIHDKGTTDNFEFTFNGELLYSKKTREKKFPDEAALASILQKILPKKTEIAATQAEKAIDNVSPAAKPTPKAGAAVDNSPAVKPTPKAGAAGTLRISTASIAAATKSSAETKKQLSALTQKQIASLTSRTFSRPQGLVRWIATNGIQDDQAQQDLLAAVQA